MEVWRDIDGYEGLYQVSNYGRVKSLDRYVSTKIRGVNTRLHKGRNLSLNVTEDGYYHVALCKNGKSRTITVHILVAKAFIPNQNNYPCVNHKDENKLNNFVWVNDDGSIDFEKSNLEWCTILYNNNYGTRNSKISVSRKKKICQYDTNGNLIKEYDSQLQAANENNYNQGNISSCLNGRIKTAHGYVWKFKKVG